MSDHRCTFTARPEHIDQLGHVNNTVWVQWIQDIAIAHWESRATEEHKARYFWVVTRHEIDYRGNVAVGETVAARTFVPEPPRGARFNRHVEFHGADGKLLVRGVSTWALLEHGSNRILRVPAELVELFLGTEDETAKGGRR